MQVTYEISGNIYRLFSSHRQRYRVAVQQALADIQQNFQLVENVLYKRNTTKLVVTYYEGARTPATERAFFSVLEQYYRRANALK